MQMTAMYWLYAGVALILLEIMTPGLVSLFFGLAALSVLYLVLLRKSLKSVFSGTRKVSDDPDDGFTGKLALVTQSIAPNKPGRVELGGTTWDAEAEGEFDVGASVRVIGKKNLTLRVEAV